VEYLEDRDLSYPKSNMDIAHRHALHGLAYDFPGSLSGRAVGSPQCSRSFVPTVILNFALQMPGGLRTQIALAIPQV
jgi:hypothetical protein